MSEDSILILAIIIVIETGVLLIAAIKQMFDKNKSNTTVVTTVQNCIEQKIGEIKAYSDSISTNYKSMESELAKNVGEIKQFASDVRTDYRSLDTMLRVPQQRGALGEIALETILADQLPPSMFGIRERVFGKNPDAHINSVSGIICVDSKFPLDNYKRMIDTNDETDKAKYKSEFLKNLRGHLQKIKDDYIHPDLGTTEFAFAYIPSESVYWFLVTECYDEMMTWAKDGVQVVSPLTISSKIALIRSGVHAKKLSDEATIIMKHLESLKSSFAGVDAAWKTFFSTHLTNAYKKAQTVDESYRKLRESFDAIQKEE